MVVGGRKGMNQMETGIPSELAVLCESMAYCHDIFCVLEPKEMLLAVQERYGSLFSMMRNG